MAQSVYLSRQTPNYAEMWVGKLVTKQMKLYLKLNFLKCDELFFLEGQRSITKK